MATLTLDQVTKVFPGGNAVLSGIDLAVADGEFLVLVGPSGCGKSTLLRIVAGLEEATSGTVSIDGKPVDGVPPRERDIAMVFQNYALYPHMSVRENLDFALRLHHMAHDERDERVRETARSLDIERLVDRKPKALSGGQRQRVATGRAIIRDPRILLMDEPLSNLDAALRVAMRAELRRLHERLRTTTLYVTHDQVEAMTLGDRIAVLDQGRIQQIGTPHDLYHRPANTFVAGFIGSPSMNFTPGERWPLPGLPAGADVTVGIRPDALHRPAPTGSPTLTATITRVEYLGGTCHVMFPAPGAPDTLWTATVGRDFDGVAGDEVTFGVDLDAIHLFDSKTGEAFPRVRETATLAA